MRPLDEPSRRTYAIWMLWMSLALLVVCIPRFNRHDLGIIDQYTTGGAPAREHLADAGQYMNHVRWFRGEVPGDVLIAPFSYRHAVPWVAQWLPTDPLTAINLLNLLAMLGTLFILERLLRHFDFGFRLRMLGLGLFVFSFPVFFYGPIGLVDPVLVFWVALACLLTYREQWFAVALVVLLGTVTRETMVLFLPVVGMKMLVKWGISWRVVVGSAGYAAVWLGAGWVCRALSPVEPDFVWKMGTANLVVAFTDPRSIIAATFSLGVPGLVALTGLMSARRLPRDVLHRYAPLMAGFATTLILYLYAASVAYVDGRHFWPGYPMSIPLALLMLQRIRTPLPVPA